MGVLGVERTGGSRAASDLRRNGGIAETRPGRRSVARVLTAILAAITAALIGLPLLPATLGGTTSAGAVCTGGTISTFAGTGVAGFSGDGGPATSAQLNYPVGPGVAVDGSDNVYIADYGNSRVRKVAPNGTITTVAGN